MARQRKHEELQGLFGSDLEFLIVDRMAVVLTEDYTMKVLCVVLMPGAEVETQEETPVADMRRIMA